MAQGGDNIIIDVLGNTRPLEKDIARVANQALTLNTKGFSQPLGKISGQLGEFEKSLAASNARVIAFGASAGAIYAVQKAFNETIKSIIDVEKALTDINVILNVNQQTLAQFGSSLFDIAKNTGLSFAEVAKSAVEFSRQGLSIEDTLKRTSDALILTRLSGLDTVSSVEALTAAINSFSSSALNSTEIVNKFAAVDAAFAVSSADLAEAIKRVGSSASDVGVSFDQLIGLVTSAQQITSRGGSVIGNSLKTIFTRLQRPKTLDALEEIGVSTKDQQGNILPLIQILSQLSNQYENLTATQKAQIAETVGGVFQINILKAALGDLSKEYSIYSRALTISGSATDEADRRNEALNETLSATINKTLANLQSAAVEIGGIAFAPALQKALGGLNYVLENFGTKDTEDIGAKIGKGLATGLGNFLSGPGLLLGAASLIKIFERLTVFTADAFKQITGLNTQSVEQKALQTQILNLIGRNPQIIDQINKGNLNTASLHQQILTLIEQETVAMQKQLAVASSLSQTLMSAGVRVPMSGPMKGSAVKTKALGFIPNLSANQEIAGAILGGYKPGDIKTMSIPNYGKVTYNTAEKIKKFPGMDQPAIMPPANSEAGKSYRKNFESQYGFNPYASKGFIPNFQADFFKKYVQIKGEELTNFVKRGAGLNPQLQKELGIVRGPGINGKETLFIKSENYDKLITQSKANLETKAFQKGQKYTQGLNNYALVYPSFNQSSPFPTYGNFEKTKVGFTAFPFPGNLEGKSRSVVGQGIYTQAIDAIVNSASQFLVKLAGVSPDLIKEESFKNYVKSNISQDQIGTLVGNAFEGGILSALNIVPEDRTRRLDLSKDELKKMEDTFKMAGLSQFDGGDFKNSLSSGNLTSMAEKILASKTNKSFGFIPNFSSIKKAMKAEKTMGGNPTLDYESGIGFYVRDKKTQPNFRKVKQDHPEGIGSAINNSFAFQKGVSALGFVPNFAANPLSTAAGTYINQQEAAGLAQAMKRLASTMQTADVKMKDFAQSINTSGEPIKKVQDDAKKSSDNLQKFKEKALYASVAFSLVGGFASELASENKALSENINGLVQGLGTATTAVGLIPGPLGLVAGGAVALYSGAAFLAKTFRDNGESIGKNLEKIKKETSEFSGSTQKYSETLQKLDEAYSDPKASNETIIKLNKELRDAAMDLPQQYRALLLSITDSVRLQEEINKITAEKSRGERATEFADKANKLLGGGTFGYGDVFKQGGLSSKSAAKELFLSLPKNVGEEAIQKISKSLLDLDKPQLITYLKDLGVENEDLLSVYQRLNEGDLEKFKTSLYLFGEDAKTAKKELDSLKPVRDAELEKIKKTKEEAARAKIAFDNLNIALENLIDSAIKSESFRQNFSQEQAANVRSIQLNKAESLIGAYEPFASAESVNQTKSTISQMQRNEDLFKSFRDLQLESRRSLLDQARVFSKELGKPKEGEEKAVSDKQLEEFNNKLLEISQKNLTTQETESAISKEISKLGIPADKTMDIQQKLADTTRDQNQKLVQLVEENKKANAIAKSNLDVQQRILQNRRDIDTAGGIQGFLDPENFQKRMESFNKYRSDYSKISNVTRGRGAAGLLSEIIQFSGGSVRPDLLKNLGGLKAEAISGRAEDIRNQARYFQKKTPGAAGRVYGDIAQRANEIARSQIENLIKDQNIGANVNEITQILRNIDDQQKTFGKTLNDGITNAFRSIETTFDSGIQELKDTLESAGAKYGLLQEKTDLQKKISEETIRKGGAEFNIQESQARIQDLSETLISNLQPFLTRRGDADIGYSPRETDQRGRQLKEVVDQIKAGQKISLKNVSALDEKTKSRLAELSEAYNTQVSTLETSKLSLQSATESLKQFQTQIDALNINLKNLIPQDQAPVEKNSYVPLDPKTAEAQAKLFNTTPEEIERKRKSLATPQINQTTQQSPNDRQRILDYWKNYNSTKQGSANAGKVNLQGTVKVEKPDSPLDLNVAGQIKIEQPVVTVKIDPGSDLTTVVTPVVQEWLDQTQGVLNEKFDSEIKKLKQDIVSLGGPRSAPSLR